MQCTQLTDMPKEWWLKNSHYQLAVIEWARQEWGVGAAVIGMCTVRKDFE